LLEGRDALIAVDHQVASRLVGHGYNDDRRLLPCGGQRGQQPPLALGSPHSQVFPAPIQLMKLQSHRQLSC
jgi:hypothetical protein